MMDHWVKLLQEVVDRSAELHRINPVMFEKLTWYLLAKYVDDVITILKTLRPGVRWSSKDKAFILSLETEEEDRGKDRRDITMEQFCSMTSNMMPSLRFTLRQPHQAP